MEHYKVYELACDTFPESQLQAMVVPLMANSFNLKQIDDGNFSINDDVVALDRINQFRRNTLTMPSCIAALGESPAEDGYRLGEKLEHLTRIEVESFLVRNVKTQNRIHYIVHEKGPNELELVLAAFVSSPQKQNKILLDRCCSTNDADQEYILMTVELVTTLPHEQRAAILEMEVTRLNQILKSQDYFAEINNSEHPSSLTIAIFPHELTHAMSVIVAMITSFNLRNKIDLSTAYLFVDYEI